MVKFQQNNCTIQKKIKALTIIDTATTWPELVWAKTKSSFHVARLMEMHWLSWYPWPKVVVHDNGEFTGEEFQRLLQSYGCRAKATTVKNPQVNAIIEQMHLKMGNMLHTTKFSGENWEEEIQVILQTTAWALCSTIHTTAGYTPGQMAFSRDMIMQMRVNVNWQ